MLPELRANTSPLAERPAAQTLIEVEHLARHIDRLKLPPRFARASLERYAHTIDPTARVVYGPAEHLALNASLGPHEWALEVAYAALPHLGLGVTSRSLTKSPRALLVYDRDTLFVRRPYTAYLQRALERVKPEELDADSRPLPWIPALSPASPRDEVVDAELVSDDAPLPRATPGGARSTGTLEDATIARWHETLCRAALPSSAGLPELELVRAEVHHHGFAAGRVWFTRDGRVRRIRVTTCPNSDLAEVLATLCHELAHPLVRSAHHDGPMKAALIGLCQKQFGARYFAHAATLMSERMSVVDAWIATGIRAALRGGEAPVPKEGDDAQMARAMGKIRKLRQLAKDQLGLPEGVAATAAANDLATLYGLTHHQLDAPELDEDRVVDRFVVMPDGAVWRRLLAHDVASYFDVFALSLPGAGRMHFFGAYADVVGAEYLYAVSARRIEREWEAHFKAWKAKRGKTTSAETRREKTSFCDSAAVAFGQKLKSYREDPDGSDLSLRSSGTQSARAFGERRERAEAVARDEHARRGRGWSSSGTRTYRENEAGRAVGAAMEVLHGVEGEQSARLTRKG